MPNSMTDIDFAALLCSRLCHDLVSPVGALSNGIEILADEDDEMMRAEVLKLLEQSANQTASKLQFFRLAFGAAGGFGETIDCREVEGVLRNFYKASKVEVDWQVSSAKLSKVVLKVVLNFCLLLGEALVRGGTLGISVKEDGSTCHAEVSASAERLILSEKIPQALSGGLALDQIDPKAVPAQLAFVVASGVGAKIDVDNTDPQKILFRATFLL